MKCNQNGFCNDSDVSCKKSQLSEWNEGELAIIAESNRKSRFLAGNKKLHFIGTSTLKKITHFKY